jgi:uroporphyrinogen decarboxylase
MPAVPHTLSACAVLVLLASSADALATSALLKGPLTAEALRMAPNPVATPEHDILLRAARGEDVERTPVWLMRQAGRYMEAFREYSSKIEFRKRSETPEIATELSLQPWRAFGVDGVIMFSDILTPLPALGVEFDVVRGTGPVIPTPLRTAPDVAALTPLEDPDSKLPFIRTILGDLRQETEGRSTLLGFVGSPFTLVAYAVEGQANRHCIQTKKMMTAAPEVLHAALDHFAIAVGQYACHQIECGAQCVQFFESWAHHVGAGQFSLFVKPYADKAMNYVRERHPDVPLVYYANGGSPYLDLQRDMAADVISLDWATDMAKARETLGTDRRVGGNVDPTILFGSEDQIRAAVHDNIRAAGGRGKHLLNLGHGVLQGTPEEAVATFVDAAKTF